MDLKQLNKLNLLYVEDDELLRKNYVTTLSLLFKEVLEAQCYKNALEIYKNNIADILLVDINLGELSGIELVKEIRKTDLKTPVIFLTAHSDNRYLLEAANLQIDGYIVKPLDLDKLQVAMKNALKKINHQSIIELDSEFVYNFTNQELLQNGQKINLGKKTNELFKLFCENKNKTITKSIIEHELWTDKTVTDSSIKNLISNIRKIIGKEKILNVMGIGWKLNIE
jgi:DNA-binding response OmpR family regulator